MTGNELKERRKVLSLRQEDLARELEVVVSSVARWEQLKDDEIPNSKMLELALNTIEGEFQIYSFESSKEKELFSKRNQLFLSLFPKLNDAIDTVYKQISPNNEFDRTIYMLGRLCVEHFHSILLLCTNGRGFSSIRILRSMFEKSVDAYYLNKNPNEIDNFRDYHFVQLKKTGFEDIAKKIDPQFEKQIEKFQIKPNSKQLKLTWSKDNLVERAKKVGMNEFLINYAYKIPNEFVHTSISEIILSATSDSNGNFIPVENENENERKFADISFSLACQLLIGILKLQIGCFDLPKQPILDEYERELDDMYKWKSKT